MEHTLNCDCLFETIREARAIVSADESKEIAASIIDVMKQHQLTYSQTYKILDVTKATLAAMSELLAL